MVYVVRHAQAGSQKHWPGPDHDRPLSARGDRQAIGLLARLGGYPVTRILSSPTVRCRCTVVPLGQQRALPVELVDALDVDAPVEGLLSLAADTALEAAVLCGHGDQIGRLLRLLGGGTGAGRPREKGSAWVLGYDAGTLRAIRYLPPLQLTRRPDEPSPSPGLERLVTRTR